jgi:class 3 adenylate cyclase
MARHLSASAGPAPAPARARRGQARWQTTLLYALPVVGVSVVMILVAAIAYYIYAANRHGATLLSNDLVNAIEERVVMQMEAYFEPPQHMLELVDTAIEGRPVFEARREAERYARRALATVPSVSALSYADADGNYLFVIRNPKGSFDSKLVDRRDGGHRVTWTRRDETGRVITSQEDPNDTFDARARPWFEAALAARKPIWTDTYSFFTLHRPGITFSIPRFGPDGKLQTVVALDIELDSLCTFLSELKIGASGKAYIIDRSGRLVAFPSDKWEVAEGETAKAPLLNEVGDPVLTMAFNRLRVEGYGRKILDIGDRRVIVSSAPVRMLSGRDWIVLIVVPESDFIGFVASNSVAALIMSLVVVLIVLSLATFLVWRNVQAGRRVAAAATRQQALEGRTRAFVELARDVAGPDETTSVARANESTATACAAERASIWRLSGDGRTLTCEDCYEAIPKGHVSGLKLHRDEMPNFFAELDKGAVIDATDARRDHRTAELHSIYLAPLDINNVHITPILQGDRPVGMLCVENPQRGDRAAGMAAFCDALAILLALRFAAEVPAPAPAPAPHGVVRPEAKATEASLHRQARLERVLFQHNASVSSLGKTSLANTAVGVVKLPNWTTVAQRSPDAGGRTAMDAIMQELREVIARSDLSYAALLDDEIVLAAFSSDPAQATRDAAAVAMTILELRDRLTALEDKWGIDLDFRFALDVGTVMASAVGSEPPSRNLWGGAVSVAKILAQTAARHTIAASETAYESLASQFLMRPRGTYFLPETGNMRTFIMVGRL